ETDEPQQAAGIVVESVGADSAKLATADLGEPVHRVEQETAGGAGQGEGNGVAGEVAAAEIVLDGGGGDLRPGASSDVLLVAGHGDFGGDAVCEKQLDCFAMFVD